tara:strand:- start:14660 stop:15073 length:414 start_codon:yes stop_codon:yes gene_type:complete
MSIKNTNEMKELKNLDVIKLESWVYETAEVNGVNGITEDQYSNVEFDTADRNPTDRWYKDTTPWTIVGATAIDNYGETDEKIAEKEKFATAIIVEDGEMVKAGNGIYTVRVARGANGKFANCSNPISFEEKSRSVRN